MGYEGLFVFRGMGGRGLLGDLYSVLLGNRYNIQLVIRLNHLPNSLHFLMRFERSLLTQSIQEYLIEYQPVFDVLFIGTKRIGKDLIRKFLLQPGIDIL